MFSRNLICWVCSTVLQKNEVIWEHCSQESGFWALPFLEQGVSLLPVPHMCSYPSGMWSNMMQAYMHSIEQLSVGLNASLCLQSCWTLWRRFFLCSESRGSVCFCCQTAAVFKVLSPCLNRSARPQISLCPGTSEPMSASEAPPCTSTHLAPQVNQDNSLKYHKENEVRVTSEELHFT